MKTRELGENTGIFYIYCEGCKCHHSLHTTHPNRIGAKWRFNQDLDRPSFSPSLNVEYKSATGEVVKKCHSYITEGNIQYLADSTHQLAGKTVPLPEISTGG